MNARTRRRHNAHRRVARRHIDHGILSLILARCTRALELAHHHAHSRHVHCRMHAHANPHLKHVRGSSFLALLGPPQHGQWIWVHDCHLSATKSFCPFSFQARCQTGAAMLRESASHAISPGEPDPTLTSEFVEACGFVGVCLRVVGVETFAATNPNGEICFLRRPTTADSTAAGFRGTRTASLAARLANPGSRS